ncbi:hypothetical protein [Lysinibacillus sphaericus]|uniref:hypothetical protein n=1 Tax=Lysinibacillus sphaericus TaxID=1421 RepID=UPI003D0367EA
MDYLATTLLHLKIENYNGALAFPKEDDTIFYLLYQHATQIEVIESFGYRKNFGLIHVATFWDNLTSIVKGEGLSNDISERTKEMYNHHFKNKYFSNALWFIKDNSVIPYFTTISSNEKIAPQITKSSTYYTLSNGKIEDVIFTIEEIEAAFFWMEVLKTNSIQIKGERKVNPDKIDNFALAPYSETTSFNRAFQYLDAVRQETFLPAKIASYISILEILCAVNGENTYKVSERVAALLGENSDEKINLFNNVKKAYDFRSKYVHGAHINYAETSKISDISVGLDDIVRRVLKTMIQNYPHLNYSNKNKESFMNFEGVDKEFIKLVLG